MQHPSRIAVALLVVLVSLLPAGVIATPLAQQGNFKVSVVGTAPGSIPHDIALKVTQIPGGQLSEATGFAISPESVVQVKQGENIIVTTSENIKAKNVKAKNVQGQQIDLLPMPNNIWSLQSLIPGVYLLDVIVDMSTSGISGVYETVLVILQPDQQPLPPTTVINELSIVIENGPPLPPNDTTPPPCPPDAPESEDCPPTDDITPVPEPPPPDCPEVGPELCGEESPPEEIPPDSGRIPTVTIMIMGMEKMGQTGMETTAKVVKIFQQCHLDKPAAIRNGDAGDHNGETLDGISFFYW